MKKADRKKERFRNEWKYLISTSEKEVLNRHEMMHPSGIFLHKQNPF